MGIFPDTDLHHIIQLSQTSVQYRKISATNENTDPMNVKSFSPAQVAHAGSQLHLPVVDVHAPAHTLHALHRHGTGHGALTLHP